MNDQLSAKDWLDQGLKALASRGFTALKAEPWPRRWGVARQLLLAFADIAAFHAAILARWHEVAAEQIIANVEAASNDGPAALLLRRVFGERLMLERAVRTWASVDPAARAAVQAIDRRRLSYVRPSDAIRIIGGCCPRPRPNSLLGVSRLRALGSALAEARQQAVLDELVMPRQVTPRDPVC